MRLHHPMPLTAIDLRRRAALALDAAPSARVFDHQLRSPRSDYDLNPEHMSELDGTRVRPAAVLVPIVDRPNALTVLLTLRTADMPSHAGQVAFPGGKMEHGETPVETALREAEEEIGLARSHVDVLGFLDSYQTGTGFRVVPVVALVSPGFTLTLSPREVADAFEVPLAFLMDQANHQRHSREWQGKTRHYYAMPYGERYIWGATAGMLRNLHERLIG